ncbi:MAG: S-layer homology domain-containing protein, partial [Clostridia bacterium]|nr:S-layer homology domain-containing protein [Clostridia bacterium]
MPHSAVRTRYFRLAAFFTAFVLLLTALAAHPVSAADTQEQVQTVMAETHAYFLDAVPAPTSAQSGGDWMMFGLARAGADIPASMRTAYLSNVKKLLTEKNGVLSKNKYTEYSRLAIAVTSLGCNARDLYGYDLLAPLTDLSRVTKQGINGAAYALLAFDCGGYAVGDVSRQDYIDLILDAVRADDTWSLTATEEANADITAMILTALAPYTAQPRVREAVENALDALSAMQEPDGGYAYRGTCTAECTAQVLVALSTLGIAADDPRFVKNGNSVLDHLLMFALDGGGFAHTHDGREIDGFATEQSYYALAAYRRACSGAPDLFCFTDRIWADGQHPDVSPRTVTAPGKTFPDLTSAHRTAVEALAARGILSGYDDGKFHPQDVLTRAQFAQILYGALGLPAEEITVFTDVSARDWYYAAAASAARVGLILGT